MVNFNLGRAQIYKRRAISSLVGGAIFLILFAGAISTFFIAMDFQRDSVNTQRAISDTMMDKTKEKFDIAASTDPDDSDRLGIHVKNQGTNPVEIGNIWVVSKSGSFDADQYGLDYRDSIIPAGYGANILENNPIYLSPDDYEVKVVSVLGTIEKSELSVGGNNYLLAEMFTIPPDVRLNENVTIALRVTNVGSTLITDISPDFDFNPNGIEPGKETWLDVPELISPSPVELRPSESTIFSWHSTLTNTGTVGGKLKFSNSVTGTESVTGFSVGSNVASDKLTVRDPKGGSGEEIVLKDELFAQPGIFMIVPNTFGDSVDEALWAITVANPTEAPMEVTKITTSILFAGANDNQWILDSGCATTNVPPTLNFWDCPNQNQLVWYDGVGPPFDTQTVPPRSAFSFIATVEPGSIQGSSDGLDSVVIHTSVFTSLGSFGETSWSTSMADGTDALANVYVSDVVDSVDPNDVQASRLGIPSTSTQRFNVVLADFDSGSSEFIRQGAQLIINIPKDWTLVTPIIDHDGFDPPTINTFPDGSSQIVGILSADLLSGGETITFDAIAPSPSCDKMYVMHILANGQTSGDRPIGPVAETVLQVNPAGPCP